MKNEIQVSSPTNPMIYAPSSEIIKQTVTYLDDLSKAHMEAKKGACDDPNCELCFYTKHLGRDQIFNYAVMQNIIHAGMDFKDAAGALVMALFFFILGMKAQQSATEALGLEAMESKNAA